MIRFVSFFLVYLLSSPVLAGDRAILILADSLSASYGIALEHGWVSLLQQRLQAQGYNYKVINASISGDTTHGARARLDRLLKETDPDITIVELGGNDGLRGLPVEEIRQNLAGIVDRLSEYGSEILLVPMLLPPNYGQVYIDRFTAVYKHLAETRDLLLGRFILDGIADKPELMQGDGIHPQAEAQPLMLENIWPDLETLLKKDQS